MTNVARVLLNWIKVRMVANPGKRFLNHMIVLGEGALLQKTPTETACTILLAALTIISLVFINNDQGFAQ